ncbi:YncE family protein [Actinoplanes couchii]|uniref:40-residue YVTN family beta-propeller repeat protein n=1 Tax=Actinoplanes couchii TaxID=403638 RepID=A0ABQ3XI52_9ACTN|nr:hypothetical protein [Actinoplanes couchii]MDR6324630.1 hypothetical protein [Actinoplanes couchii]GID58183.1 hypothetical protein Aco03nite_065870 [Actinoplanes couchii]
MSNRRVGAVVAAVLTGTTALVATPASADDTRAALTITSIGDMLVDGVHERVFISDPSAGQVIATDYSGKQVGTVDVPGAGDLALTADSSRLYVASPGTSAVVALDTATLDRAATYSTGEVKPDDVTVAGGRIWFSYVSGGGALGTIDPATETVSLNRYATGQVRRRTGLRLRPARPDRCPRQWEDRGPGRRR